MSTKFIPLGHPKSEFWREEIDNDFRKKLLCDFGKNQIYCCECGKEYKMSSDLKIYPIRNNQKHLPECPESEKSKKINRSMHGFSKITKDDSVIIKTRLKSNPTAKNSYLGAFRRYQDKQVKEIDFASFCKNITLMAYSDKKNYRSSKSVTKFIWTWLMKTVFVFNGTEYSFNKTDFPYEICYGTYSKIEEKIAKNNQCYFNLTLTDSDKKERNIYLSQDSVDNMFTAFKKEYRDEIQNCKTMIFVKRIRSNGQLNVRNRYWDDTEIVAFPVSKNGCVCDSICEQKIFNMIEYLELNNDFIFYKPYEYQFSAYGDKFLEDGRIRKVGSDKTIVLELFDQYSEKLKDQKELKKGSYIDNPNRVKISVDFSKGEFFNSDQFIRLIHEL